MPLGQQKLTFFKERDEGSLGVEEYLIWLVADINYESKEKPGLLAPPTAVVFSYIWTANSSPVKTAIFFLSIFSQVNSSKDDVSFSIESRIWL